jgi:hypothetical protein
VADEPKSDGGRHGGVVWVVNGVGLVARCATASRHGRASCGFGDVVRM